MLRRCLACLTALMLLAISPAHALALSDTADLAILSQWDECLMDSAFRYNNNYFRFNGCGPASIANGVIAALDITDHDQAVAILRDLLYLLGRSNPAKNRIMPLLLDYMNVAPDHPLDADPRYPTLNEAMLDFGGPILYYDGRINAQNLPSLLPASHDTPTIIHGIFTKDDRWTSMRELIQVLTDAGYEDARIVLSFLGAGTDGTKSPFRSGSAGHYLCVCIPMAEFLQSGEFYVLDSLPRALAGEEFAQGLTYQIQYDFVKKYDPYAPLNEFNDLFEVIRITPTIVQPVPIGEAQKSVAEAQENGSIPLDALMPYLNQVMQFHGESRIFITLPAQ